MPKKPRPQSSRGEGPSRHQDTEQHGWSPDVDKTRQQENPSASRSFQAEEHAPPRGKGRKASREEKKSVPGDTAKSTSRRGESQAERPEKGMRDTGRKGRSQRPSGTKDDSAFTGVDPDDDSTTGRRPG
ncbi:hypothetical protein FE633_24200 [Streptomyces montanus]|uniref:Uncharacterized protein n=1 Tax=Streptomyces montanus TaxID=2580423 RepID=A0A5R9FQE2_9ACTN|nr:hypothetical protein [Streptomyces montanus]TLS43688.1 hypothetical protein FE633_24200 [Streptomyces montanus]